MPQTAYHPLVPVYEEILSTLSKQELTLDELIKAVRKDAETASRTADLRAAVLPLILTGRIELTRGRKLRLPAAVGNVRQQTR